MAIRRRRGSNHASLVSTYAYGRITTSFSPAFSTRRPNEAIASPCAVSCTATTAKRPSEEDEPAEADLVRDDERGAVAQADQRAEHADARDAQRREEPQRGAREQHPAAVPVERLEARPDAGEHLLARRDQPAPERRGLLGLRARARDAGEEPALAQVGEQAREPRRARGAEALLGLADQVGERARAVEQLEQLRVLVRQPQVAVAREVAQHPAPLALVRVQALERVARAHPRAHAELGRLRGSRRRSRRPRPTTSDAPGRTTIVRPASASSRRRSTVSSWSPMRMRAPSRSATGPVTRVPSTYVPWLEPASSIRAPLPLPAAEMRAWVRETLGSSSCSDEPGRRARSRARCTSGTRSPPASTSSSGASPPPSGRAAAAAERSPARHLAAAVRAQHGAGAQSAESGWNVALSPLRPERLLVLRDRRSAAAAARRCPSAEAAASLRTTTTCRPSGRQITLHARTPSGFARSRAARSSPGGQQQVRPARCRRARRPRAACRRATTPRRARPGPARRRR